MQYYFLSTSLIFFFTTIIPKMIDTINDSEQLLQNCKDKNYIKSNLEHLKAHFSSSQNIDTLKQLLTTNNNFTALKIIEQLNLKIMPFIHINTHTFVSIYWLNRMKVLSDEEFEFLLKKFEILKNFDVIYEETEKNYIKLQIEKRRRLHLRGNKANNSVLNVRTLSMYFKVSTNRTFVLCLDDFIDSVDFEKYVNEKTLGEEYGGYRINEDLFGTTLKTFEKYADDPLKNEKIYRFRDVKLKLANCPFRSFSQFNKLEERVKVRIERMMVMINKIKKCSYRYYIYSYKPLSSILTFCYLYLNNIDLTKIIEIETKEDIDRIVSGKKVIINLQEDSESDLSALMDNLRYLYIDLYSS